MFGVGSELLGAKLGLFACLSPTASQKTTASGEHKKEA
jgi:hypothetical protein